MANSPRLPSWVLSPVKHAGLIRSPLINVDGSKVIRRIRVEGADSYVENLKKKEEDILSPFH